MRFLPYLPLLLPVAFIVFVNGAALMVFRHSFRMMVSDKQSYIDIGAWIAVMVAFCVNLFSFEGIGIPGFAKVTEKSGGIALIFSSILLPLFVYKWGAKNAEAKSGSAEPPSGGG